MSEWLDTGARPPRRRRLAALGLVVLLVLLGWAVPRVKTAAGWLHRPEPGTQRTAPPAAWPAGTWVRTHRVDLPAGWHLVEERVEANRSSSVVSGLTTRGGPLRCTVTVAAAAETVTLPERAVAVRVGDVAGQFAPYDAGLPRQPHGVFWRGPVGQWASVACPADRRRTVALAERVSFATSPVQVPFRLTALPAHYVPTALTLPAGGDPVLTSGPDATDPDADGPALRAWYRHEDAPRSARDEWVSVNGRSARMSAASGRICLQEAPVICVESEEGGRRDHVWDRRLRDQLMDVAAGVATPTDPRDRTSWFDGTAAFPT